MTRRWLVFFAQILAPVLSATITIGILVSLFAQYESCNAARRYAYIDGEIRWFNLLQTADRISDTHLRAQVRLRAFEGRSPGLSRIRAMECHL